CATPWRWPRTWSAATPRSPTSTTRPSSWPTSHEPASRERPVRLGARFPLGKPNWPTSVPRPAVVRRTGVDFETDWARRGGARLARAMIVDDVLRPVLALVASPQVHGEDRL